MEFMNEIYQQVKNECTLPAALLTFTFRESEGTLNPFRAIFVSFRDSDETNIKKMEEVKKAHGESFMFFNCSEEGKEYWKNNPIVKLETNRSQ